jgi:hypothetical protein
MKLKNLEKKFATEKDKNKKIIGEKVVKNKKVINVNVKGKLT